MFWCTLSSGAIALILTSRSSCGISPTRSRRYWRTRCSSRAWSSPSFIFQGWRVVAVSWEVGGRLYACSDGGIVVALDYPLCHFELRFVATASPDSLGADADRLETRFLSAGDRLDMSASTARVPPTWLVFSRISGPTLIRNARWCRDHGARVECPDQQLQLAQLAAVHANWTSKIEAPTEEETGPRISAIAVESNPINVHLVSEPSVQDGACDREC